MIIFKYNVHKLNIIIVQFTISVGTKTHLVFNPIEIAGNQQILTPAHKKDVQNLEDAPIFCGQMKLKDNHKTKVL